LKLFLFESEYIARKKSISEALFMKNQWKKMLKYHDNYDVFNEKKLLKWQHFVLDKLCEQMSRVLKKNAHMKLFKKLRTQLQDAQIENEITLISVEISIFFKLIWKYLMIIDRGNTWSETIFRYSEDIHKISQSNEIICWILQNRAENAKCRETWSCSDSES
jgi:hypothetical protein